MAIGSPRGRCHGAHAFLSRVMFLVIVMGVPCARAQAQGTKDSHWGVAASSTPKWTIAEPMRKVLFEGDGTIKGSEFTFGLVRGSTRGGDWGVSFVRKPFKDGSGETSTDQQCFNPAQTQCAMTTESTVTQGVYLNGVQVHWFIAFATIKSRVQVGLNVGAGVATVNGNVVKTKDGFTPSFNQQTPQTGLVTLTPTHTVETLPAKDEWLSMFPLGKVEAEGAVIVTPALKIKAAGGLNFPSIGMRVGVVYLIGAK
jgi:hypothetical protein